MNECKPLSGGAKKSAKGGESDDDDGDDGDGGGDADADEEGGVKAGAYTRSHLSST